MKYENYILCSDGKKRQAVSNECKQCNKEFFYRKRKDRKQYFCSDKCKYLFSRIEVSCALCGNKFLKRKSRLDKSRHGIFFCSRKCKDFGQRLDGGIEEIRPSHYGNGQYNYQNFINDNTYPKCIDCKEDRRYLLCVHHIDSNRTNNTKNNLEVVCYNCHVRRHLDIDGDKITYRTQSLTPRHILKEL